MCLNAQSGGLTKKTGERINGILLITHLSFFDVMLEFLECGEFSLYK
jgi:hypothetical protein